MQVDIGMAFLEQTGSVKMAGFKRRSQRNMDQRDAINLGYRSQRRKGDLAGAEAAEVYSDP